MPAVISMMTKTALSDFNFIMAKILNVDQNIAEWFNYGKHTYFFPIDVTAKCPVIHSSVGVDVGLSVVK